MTERTETCAVCGVGTAVERARTVELQPLGRLAVYRRREWRCKDCRDAYTDDAQGAANEAAELAAKAGALRVVEGTDLRWLRDAAGITQSELEGLLGLGTNTVARWETGQRPLPAYIGTVVRLLALHPTALRELAAVERLQREEEGGEEPAPGELRRRPFAIRTPTVLHANEIVEPYGAPRPKRPRPHTSAIVEPYVIPRPKRPRKKP